MPLRDDQWNDFLKATIRITLTASSRRSIVIDVAGTDADNDPWADFLAIHGKNEFIKEITTHLRRVEDRRRIILFLTAILSYTHNDGDKETIGSLIKLVETGIGSTSKPIAKEPRSFPTPAEPIAMPESDEKPIDYIDFEIHLDAYEIQGEKKVSAKLDCRDATGKEIVSLAGPCYLNSLADPLPFNPTSETRQPEVVGYGHQIYSKIFSSDLGEKLGEVLGEKPDLIRIGISSTGTKVPNHLWELICRQSNAETFLSLDSKYSVARIVKNDSPSDLRRLEGPIKMLIGHASPIGTDRIPEEHANRFEHIANSNGHDAEPLPALNFDSIQNLFDTVQDKQFHVVHLICHGKFLYDLRGVLVFEDVQGRKQNIEPSVLAQVLKRVSPSLVILQACHSGDMDSSTDFVSGVAETLVRFGIPAVLAFRGKPNIDFAFEFLSKVYEKWLPGQVPIEAAIQSARLAIRNSQTNSLVARPIDAWSLPVLYRQPGVFLLIVKKSGPGPGAEEGAGAGAGAEPTPDRLAVLIDYLVIILESQREILQKTKEFLKREGLLNTSSDIQDRTEAELVANLLITPRPNRSEGTRCAIFLQMLGDWVQRKYRFTDEGQRNGLRSMRDTVFLASLPEEDTTGMVKAISNAIQEEAPKRSVSAEIRVLDMNIAYKIGRYAHAIAMDLKSPKSGDQPFVFQLLNKQFDNDDTSILFEDKFYGYEVVREPEGYRVLNSPMKRIEAFAKGCKLEGYNPSGPRSYLQTLTDHLDVQFDRRRLVFVLVKKPAEEAEIEFLQEIMDAFSRMVFIQASPDGNATIYEAIMMQMAEIDQLLHRLFTT